MSALLRCSTPHMDAFLLSFSSMSCREGAQAEEPNALARWTPYIRVCWEPSAIAARVGWGPFWLGLVQRGNSCFTVLLGECQRGWAPPPPRGRGFVTGRSASATIPRSEGTMVGRATVLAKRPPGGGGTREAWQPYGAGGVSTLERLNGALVLDHWIYISFNLVNFCIRHLLHISYVASNSQHQTAVDTSTKPDTILALGTYTTYTTCSNGEPSELVGLQHLFSAQIFPREKRVQGQRVQEAALLRKDRREEDLLPILPEP